MSGKVSDLPIRYKRAVFTQNKLDRINFRSGNGGRVLRNPPGVTSCCCSRAWSHDSLSHGIDKMADPVMLSIFGVQLLMFVQVVVIRCEICDGFSATIWYRCKETAGSHSEISRVEPLSDLPIAFIFSVYLSDLAIRFSMFRQTLSDIDRSKVKSDKLLAV